MGHTDYPEYAKNESKDTERSPMREGSPFEACNNSFLHENQPEDWDYWQKFSQAETLEAQRANLKVEKTVHQKLFHRRILRWVFCSTGLLVASFFLVKLTSHIDWAELFNETSDRLSRQGGAMVEALNNKLPSTAGSGLFMTKRNYMAGEEMSVKVLLDGETQGNVFLCCVTSGDPCKAPIIVQATETNILTLPIEAPKLAGSYDLNLYTGDDFVSPLYSLPIEIH